MTASDPQTAANAAAWGLGKARLDRIDAVLANPNRYQKYVLKEAACDLRTGLRRYEAAFAQLTAELEATRADNARLTAELEQVRGERAAAQPPVVAELMRLTPEQLSARRCAWCSPNPTMAGLWCLCIAACGNTNCKHDEVETTSTRPAGSSDAEGAGKGPESHGDPDGDPDFEPAQPVPELVELFRRPRVTPPADEATL